MGIRISGGLAGGDKKFVGTAPARLPRFVAAVMKIAEPPF